MNKIRKKPYKKAAKYGPNSFSNNIPKALNKFANDEIRARKRKHTNITRIAGVKFRSLIFLIVYIEPKSQNEPPIKLLVDHMDDPSKPKFSRASGSTEQITHAMLMIIISEKERAYPWDTDADLPIWKVEIIPANPARATDISANVNN